MNDTTDHDFAGIRIERACAYVDAGKIADKIAADLHITPRDYRHTYHDYLAGWDAAMEQRFPELLEENTELHHRLNDLDMHGIASAAELQALRAIAVAADCIVEGNECTLFEMELLKDGLAQLKLAKEARSTNA